ncbi:MAG: hypothetical protein WCP11_00055 [Candidatus Saccharibacteria bacterium]
MKEVEIGSSLFERLRKNCPEQHSRAAEINARMHWGFHMGSIPVEPLNFEPRTDSEIPVLAIYLPDKHTRFGIQVTFDGLWYVVEAPDGYRKYRDKSVESHHFNMELVDGLSHTHDVGMGWIGYDINANKYKSPAGFWDCPFHDESGVYVAHSENLAMAALCPELVAAIDGINVAHPNFAGYRITGGLDGGSKSHVPYLHLCENDKELKLDATYADLPFADFSSPTARKLY